MESPSSEAPLLLTSLPPPPSQFIASGFSRPEKKKKLKINPDPSQAQPTAADSP